MRFGRIHRLMTDALAVLGMLALLTSGGLERWVVVVLAAGLVAAMLIPEKYQGNQLRRRGSWIGSVALLAVQAARLFLGHDVIQVAVEFAAGLQILRIATRRGAAHDQQIVLLSLLHLIAGTVLGGGMAYGLCFLGFLIVAPGALVLSHLRREVEGNYRQGARDRSGLPVDVPRILRSRRVVSRRFLLATCSLAIPIFAFTAMLFVFFPRVGLSLLLLNQGRSERMIGFSDRVDLGKVGKLRADSTIALRVYPEVLPAEPPPRVPLYLRGAAFDSYDGVSWRRDTTQVSAQLTDGKVWLHPTAREVAQPQMTIDLEPIKPPVLFLPNGVAALEIVEPQHGLPGQRTEVTRGREGDFQYSRYDERGVRYRVYAAPAGSQPLDAAGLPDKARYLSLPPGMSERVAALARRWAGDSTQPLEIAARIEKQLRTEYRYDLESPSGSTPNPLEHFLFESKRGHCEFYSTAMAVMLRTLGVPSRNVTGFIGGTFNRFGRFYVVRQGEAHSWVEAHLPGIGWHRFDPTPAAAAAPAAEMSGLFSVLRDMIEAAGERWQRHVIGYDLGQQMELFSQVRRTLRGNADGAAWLKQHGRTLSLLVVVGAALSILGWWWYRRRRLAARKARAARGMVANDVRIVRLYQALEDAMRQHGITRSAATPPLAHARALRELGHPLADEAYELTEWYLAVRFGRRAMDEAGYAEFAARVNAVRAAAKSRAA